MNMPETSLNFKFKDLGIYGITLLYILLYKLRLYLYKITLLYIL